MRHFWTIVVMLCLSRVINKAIDHKDWETLILGIIIMCGVGIGVYLLSKHDVK